MDAVGDLLAQRQDDRISWGGAILLALLLHAGILTGFLLSSMAKPVKYSRPRAVAHTSSVLDASASACSVTHVGGISSISPISRRAIASAGRIHRCSWISPSSTTT